MHTGKTMNSRRCLKIAEHMNARLLTEIGQGIVAPRMLAEPLYARDVLLVCDALRGSDLANLAQLYRAAEKAEPADEDARPSSGFGAFLSSIFGPTSTSPGVLDAVPPPPKGRNRSWFERQRK